MTASAGRTTPATDQLPGSTGTVASASAHDGSHGLQDLLKARGLPMPSDLVSGFGAGGTTLWKINAAQMLVVADRHRDALVDDPFDNGRTAATAALSAIHAVGAVPLFARLVCRAPVEAPVADRRAWLEGVAVAIGEAGAILADARLADAPRLRFEVLVAGVVRPDRLRGTLGAQADDVLILSGPLGTGIYAAAQAKHRLSDDDRRTLVDHATRNHRAGIVLGTIRNVHAVVEVGPEGLIAALFALCDPATLDATIDATRVAALPRALALAKGGCVAPESSRNWNRDGARVGLADRVMPETRALLTDPAATGALLIACKRESVDRVLGVCRTGHGVDATAIGSLVARSRSHEAGRPRPVVTITA